MVGLFSTSLVSKIQNLAFFRQSLVFFSYKLLATLRLCVQCTQRSGSLGGLGGAPKLNVTTTGVDSFSFSSLLCSFSITK